MEIGRRKTLTQVPASPQLRRVSAAVVGRHSAGSVGKSRFQAVRPIAAPASSSGSRGDQNTDMDVVTELKEPVQARAEMNAEEYGKFGAGAPAQPAAEGHFFSFFFFFRIFSDFFRFLIFRFF